MTDDHTDFKLLETGPLTLEHLLLRMNASHQQIVMMQSAILKETNSLLREISASIYAISIDLRELLGSKHDR